jgi:hypothetical protein
MTRDVGMDGGSLGRSGSHWARRERTEIIRSWYNQPQFQYSTLQNTKSAIVTCLSKEAAMEVPLCMEGGAVDGRHDDVRRSAGVS